MFSKRSSSPASASRFEKPTLDVAPPAQEDPFYEVGDFWNDPRRWDGVDSHKTCFWMIERGPMPVYDYLSQRYMQFRPANNPYANIPAGIYSSTVNMSDLLNTRPGGIIRYR